MKQFDIQMFCSVMCTLIRVGSTSLISESVPETTVSLGNDCIQRGMQDVHATVIQYYGGCKLLP